MYNYSNLSDKELLKMVIMEKSNEDIADKLFNDFTSLSDLIIDLDEIELIRVKGIGIKRAQQIKAIHELSKRLYINVTNTSSFKITQPNDIANLMMPEMRYLKKEYLKVILLNTKNIVIGIEDISIGTLNSSLVHPRETFSIAIRKSAASIVVCHNHPSGDPSPSSEDINITHRLKDCGKLIGIELIDHVIIGNGKYISLKEKGFI